LLQIDEILSLGSNIMEADLMWRRILLEQNSTKQLKSVPGSGCLSCTKTQIYMEEIALIASHLLLRQEVTLYTEVNLQY